MKTNNFKKMKAGTLLTVLLMSFVLTSSCAPSTPNPPVEFSISWSEIDQAVGLEVGNILELVLPSNRSTGYAWEVGFYNQSVIRPYGEPEFVSTSPNVGAEETEMLHFEAIGEGETELVLVYRRPFEKEGPGQKTFQVHVVVDKARSLFGN